MKVLFLDIDGVLNSHQWVMNGGGYGYAMRDRPPSKETLKWDPAAVRNLRNVIEATGAQIVVSSSWRGFGRNARQAWQEMFACYDWPDAPVIDETPDLNRLENGIYVFRIRGDEVAAWLACHPEVQRYVCLDDDSDFRPEQPLVKTDIRFGLTMVEASQCRKLLDSPQPGAEKQ